MERSLISLASFTDIGQKIQKRDKKRNLRVSDNSTSNVILIQDKFTLESTDL